MSRTINSNNITALRIAEARKNHKLTQGQLAVQLSAFINRDTPLTIPTISAWETGRQMPSEKMLNVQEGVFDKTKTAIFAIANVAAHVIGWVVVAPVLDILIYAEPVKKVFAQGVFAAISNTITGVIVGGLLIVAYTKTIAKKGSLDRE